MSVFNGLKKKNRDIFSVFKTLSLVAVVVFLFSVNFNLYKERKERIEGINEIKKEIEEEQKEYNELKSEASATGEKEYWEAKIREQGYKKPGEKQVVVLPLEEIEEATTTKEKSFWENIKERVTNLITF